MRRRAKIEIRIKTYSGRVVPIILYSHTTGLGLDSVSSREKKKGVKGVKDTQDRNLCTPVLVLRGMTTRRRPTDHSTPHIKVGRTPFLYKTSDGAPFVSIDRK